MAPNSTAAASPGVLFEDDIDANGIIREDPTQYKDNSATSKPYTREIVWPNVYRFIYIHLASFYGVYLIFAGASLLTTAFAFLLFLLGIIGITAGAHRLWSHRAYKARFPLKVLLMVLQTLAFQNSIYEWARDHRVHHKHSETDADPTNPNRGFFFAHMGWLLVRKHPAVIEKGNEIDLSDLLADPVVAFQKKHYGKLLLFYCFFLPTIIPMIFWGESFSNAWHVAAMLRWLLTLNGTWLVNSVAHMYGQKPYDKSIGPAENAFVAIYTLGEGWHNYHHVFPWDYKTSELGKYSTNMTTAFIDFFAKLGWAYDLKTVSPALIAARAKRTGDGTHDPEVWGWGDKDMSKLDMDKATIINGKKSE